MDRMDFRLNNSINAVCPYYTMFPLDFPLRIISANSTVKSWIVDPFCGRGTANFAARLLGRSSIGVDCNPVAVAIAKAKVASADTDAVIRAATVCLKCDSQLDEPTGQFWKWAYHPRTLNKLCRLRSGLLRAAETPATILLKAIVLGALHGPLSKTAPSYFSNQCPRSFAPKPNYAVNFWRARSLRPPAVDVMDLIRRRAVRYLSNCIPTTPSAIYLGNSQDIHRLTFPEKVSLIVTSPPYYGMKTYVPDQWLRNWFLGGPSDVQYGQPEGSLVHRSPEIFAAQLHNVWSSVAKVCLDGARLVCRFGGINDRKTDPLALVKQSLKGTGWQINTIKDAGTALSGRRQAFQFGDRPRPTPKREYDIYARLQ